MDVADALVEGLDSTEDLPPSELSRYARGMKRLVNAVQLLSTARDVASIMAVVRRAAREVTGADGATLVLREGDLCFYADEDAIAPLWKGRRFPIGDCISGWTMLHAEPVVLEDIYLDDRIPAAAYRPTFVKSLVMVPIGRAVPLGAIGNYWASQRRARPYELELLQSLADATASALENVQRSAELAARYEVTARELAVVNAELASLAYSVSHDLRAPLRAVLGFNQALIDDHLDKLDTDGADCLRRVHTSAHRLSHFLDDLLDLSRIVRADMTRAPVDLSSLAQEIARDLARAEPQRSVRVIVAPDLRVEGDPRLLRRALGALLANAWKFTRTTSDAEIHVTGDTITEGNRLLVRDNGVGFDEKYSSKLFSPFQRLHAAEEFPGNGMGLALVKRIVMRHGGSVSASGKRGEGALFGFTLPR